MGNAAIQPYLFFGGRCEEALAFYGAALGAEVDLMMRHNESPEAHQAGVLQAGFENKIMHTSFHIGNTKLMASDGCNDDSHFSGFALSLMMPTEAEVKRAFAALAEGGQVRMPLTQTFWSPCFGMLTDKFGISWMLGVEGKP
jgi:PhnB protein